MRDLRFESLQNFESMLFPDVDIPKLFNSFAYLRVFYGTKQLLEVMPGSECACFYAKQTLKVKFRRERANGHCRVGNFVNIFCVLSIQQIFEDPIEFFRMLEYPKRVNLCVCRSFHR